VVARVAALMPAQLVDVGVLAAIYHPLQIDGGGGARDIDVASTSRSGQPP
jgi:hypothetical protein